MEVTFNEIKKANETIKTTDIKGKDYAEVNQRIKAFRMIYPEGTIATDMLSNDNGVCVFKAYVYSSGNKIDNLLATGTAYEKENSSFINKTSYIENCETSAVGRALGFAGFGIDTSVASYEEVANAIEQQEDDKKQETISKQKEDALRQYIINHNIDNQKVLDILGKYGYEKLNQIKLNDYIKIQNELGD